MGRQTHFKAYAKHEPVIRTLIRIHLKRAAERGGLVRNQSTVPTMLVRKHAAGLTRAPETGYGSDIRQQYQAEIKRRSDGGTFRLDSVAIADWEIDDGILHPQALGYRYPEPTVDVRQLLQAMDEAKALVKDLHATLRPRNNFQRDVHVAAEKWLGVHSASDQQNA